MEVRAIKGVAGAGKSTWLAQVLSENQPLFKWSFKPENSLLISYTRNAREVLKRKLPERWHSRIFTFHSYLAKQLIKQKRGIKFLEQRDIDQWFMERGYEKIKFLYEDYQVVDMDHPYTHISRMRNLMLTPEEYLEYGLLETNQITDDEFLAIAYEYMDFLKRNDVYDYSRILEEGKNIKVDVEYIFIDEAQDTTPLQWEFVKNTNAKVLMIGDPNQSIFGFAGSDDEIFANQKAILLLDQSYRCPSEVVFYAINYMEHPIKMKPVRKGGSVEFVRTLDELIDEVDPKKETLILTYTVRSSLDLSRLLRNARIPHKLFGTDPAGKDYVRLWRLYNLSLDELTLDDFFVLKKSKLRAKKFIERFSNLGHIKASALPDVAKVLKDVLDKIVKYPPSMIFALDPEKIEEVFMFYDPNTKVNVSTIHRVKGGEAPNVLIFFDVHKKLSRKNINYLLYTAFTRSSDRVVALLPPWL